MCAQSQFIPARTLWQGFNPLGFAKGTFVIFNGYIDESYDNTQNVFTLSCLVARGKVWDSMERRWKLAIAAKNKELAREGRPQISRYHASDCSACRGEFEGWSKDERDAFVINLFQLFKVFPSHTVVFDAQMDDICEVFPEWSFDRLEAAYHLLTGFVMHQLGRDFAKQSNGTPVKITLFHEETGSNGKYDPTILRSYNFQRHDKEFAQRDYFTTIASLRWEHCIALQPADLVAFECFKEAQARTESRRSRKSYKALIDMKSFGIHSMSFNPKAIRALRARMEEQQQLGIIGHD